jgi:hypothetical protein
MAIFHSYVKLPEGNASQSPNHPIDIPVENDQIKYDKG